MPSLEEQIAQLESAIAAQEALRPTLGDAVVSVTLNALRAQLDALRAQQQVAASPESEPSSDELLARLQTYIPKELAAKMRATGRIEGERKQVTVMFADLSGFTALSERLDPEEVTTLTNEALKELAEAVYQYEGYIDKFIGDAIMAVFGAPVAHEDDPERALRVALAMRERLENFNRRWADRLGQPLALHIGVNTGPVIAGNVGSDLRLSYTVMGDTVNTAFRLESAAEAGQFFVSRDTYRLTHAAFTFVAHDPIMVKGKRELLPVFELQRAKLLPGKSRGVKELGSAFVGRERELAKLREVVSELATGRGRIVSINGEAGIGKSRLLAEWCAEIGDRMLWLEGHAFAHTTSLAYGPFLDFFRRYAGIKDDDSEAEARARVDAALEQLFPGDAEAEAIFANLLALRLTPEESTLLAAWPGEVLRRRLFVLVAELFKRLTRERPVILILEDLHWADLTSLELIESLLPLTGQLPLAVVGVRRLHADERPSQLRMVVETRYADRFTDVPLTPLSEASGLSMVEQLLSTSAIPEGLHAIILRKAEGNPFFVEEVIRSLIERGALMRTEAGWVATPLMESVSVPDTIQGVLMARLDRLPDETKWVVQQASVIGRIFLYRVLLQMSERNANMDADLRHLEHEELVREHARLPDVEYIFKHALTQEVAYQSLLTPRRKELHRKVGEAMEAIFSDRLPGFYSIIGEHFLRGEAWDKANDYLIKAGDAAAQLYAHAEARLHYANVLEALTHLADNEDNRRCRVDTIIKQASVSFVVDPTRNLAHLAEAESLAKALPGPERTTPDRLLLARVHYWMGRLHFYRGETREAMGYYRQVLAVAQETGDEELLAIPSTSIGQLMLLQGQWGKALSLFTQAVAPLEKVANWLEWIRTVGFIGMSLAARGNYVTGMAEVQRAQPRAREMNTLTGLAANHIQSSIIHFFGGNILLMLENSRACVEVAEQSGDRVYVYMGHGSSGWAESRLGHHEAAIQSMAQRKTVAQSLGGRLLLADWFAAADAEIAFNAGRIEEAITLAEKTVETGEAIGGLFGPGLAHRIWGVALIRLHPPQWSEAESHLAESLRSLELGEARLEAARTHVAWGIVCRERGDVTAAREHFEKAAVQFETSELVDELQRTRSLIARV